MWTAPWVRWEVPPGRDGLYRNVLFYLVATLTCFYVSPKTLEAYRRDPCTGVEGFWVLLVAWFTAPAPTITKQASAP